MSATPTQTDPGIEATKESWQIPVHDPQSAWIVERGFVDLFYASVADDLQSGPRRHVLRAASGGVIFGFPADIQETANRRFFLVRSLEAEVRHVDLRKLKELGPGGEPNISGTELLRRWIESISLAVAPEVTPRDFTGIEAGGAISVSAGSNVSCLRDIVWIRHRKGSSQFLGLSGGVAIGENGFFPLICRTWVTAGQDSVLDGFETGDVQKADPDWTSLIAFHRLVTQTLIAREAEDEKRERERLRSKKQNNAWQMSAALETLTIPLNGKSGFTPPVRNANPLVSACQIVGSVLGIEIRVPTEMGRGTVSRDSILDIARASNVRVRQVLLRGSWWTSNHGPLLGSWQDTKKPVALIPDKRGGYEVADPSAGTRITVKPDIVVALDPYATVFYRSFPDKKLKYWDLLQFGIEGFRSDLWLILLAGLAGGLLSLPIPLFAGMLFDSIIPGAQRNQLLQITVLLLLAGVISTLFDATRALTLLRVEGKMGASLQAAMWDRLISLPVVFFRRYSAGDLADRANGIDEIRAALTGTLTNSIVAGIFSCLNLGLMVFYSWHLTTVGLGLVVIGVTATIGFGALQVQRGRTYKTTFGRLSGEVLQFVGGIAKFRVSGTEARPFGVWSRGYSRMKTAASVTRSAANDLIIFKSFFFVFCQIILFYSLDRWQIGIGAGNFIAFNTAFGAMLIGVMNLAGAVSHILAQIPVYERAMPILETRPEVDSGKATPGELAGSIEVSHLVFRYDPDGPIVLEDISMRIAPGEFIALVGPSGCGKSTLLRALLGFEHAESGAVYFDGKDLRGLDAALVRRQIGVVLQNSTLFRGDIFTNILGSKPLTMDDAWEAARMAGLEQDIRRLPMSMHTIIAEGGGGLSGGQRQRLMIARAIVSKPRILLFDEATSALDNQSQAIVSRSLEGLKSTRVVIAHRLSTIIHADRIYVLDRGRIVENGTYSELMSQDGLFAQLAKRQLN